MSAALCALAIVLTWLDGDASSNTQATTTTPKETGLPGGATSILPEHRVVAYYGAPNDDNLGILGIGTPEVAASKLLQRVQQYETPKKPVMPAMELIAVIATSAAGEGNLHRQRQPDEVIQRYLDAARAAGAILILDIQPGRANFLDEAKALQKYLKEPDVSLALDPEWHIKGDELPGKVIGSVTAAEVNAVSKWLSDMVVENKLPEKIFLVHQFTEGMILNRGQLVPRPGLDMVLNADGFGTPVLKIGVYKRIMAGRPKFMVPGYKLFFVEDEGLMEPREVLRMRPAPQIVVYE